MKRSWMIGIVAVLVLLVAVGAQAQKKATKEKQVTIEEKQKPTGSADELKDIDNPKAEFTIDLWTDRENATYKVGEEIIFSFKTNKDCRLNLFNVATSGTVQLLFPNQHQKDNRVKAGETYRIPAGDASWVFKAAGPAGVDFVKAIATLDKVDLVAKADLKPAGPVQEIKKPESTIAKDIEISLKPVNPKRWSEAEKPLTITE